MVVKLLGKEIDIKGDYEDVKGILAEFDFSARPSESRAGGVRDSLGDSEVSNLGIKEKAWEDWRSCDRWCSGRATGGSGSTQLAWFRGGWSWAKWIDGGSCGQLPKSSSSEVQKLRQLGAEARRRGQVGPPNLYPRLLCAKAGRRKLLDGKALP